MAAFICDLPEFTYAFSCISNSSFSNYMHAADAKLKPRLDEYRCKQWLFETYVLVYICAKCALICIKAALVCNCLHWSAHRVICVLGALICTWETCMIFNSPYFMFQFSLSTGQFVVTRWRVDSLTRQTTLNFPLITILLINVILAPNTCL